MKINKRILVSAMAFLWCSPLTQATEINWNGFMSIAAGKTLDEDTIYQVEPTTGGAYDNEIRFDPESIVGLQAQAVITDKLRGTVQMVSKGASDYDTSVDWAYLSYDLTDNLTLNAGRFRLPLYYYSDFLDVGYAYHWIRPPVEVYNTTTSTLEGVNLYHSFMLGNVEFDTQVWYGAIDKEMTSEWGGETFTTSFDALNNTGINTVLTWEWFKLRLLYNTTDITSEITGFGQSDIDVTFAAVAFMVDYENFIWRSEKTRSDTTTTTAASAFGPGTTTEAVDNSWYVSAGYNIDDFTPHATHTVVDVSEGSFMPKTRTNTFGVAWGFHPSATLKVEYLETKREATAFTPPEDVRVISTAIDILF